MSSLMDTSMYLWYSHPVHFTSWYGTCVIDNNYWVKYKAFIFDWVELCFPKSLTIVSCINLYADYILFSFSVLKSALGATEDGSFIFCHGQYANITSELIISTVLLRWSCWFSAFLSVIYCKCQRAGEVKHRVPIFVFAMRLVLLWWCIPEKARLARWQSATLSECGK